MSDELEAIIFDYMLAHEQGLKPRLIEWVERFPQYSKSLIEFAIYWHIMENTPITDEERQLIENTPLEIEREALDKAFGEWEPQGSSNKT